MHPAGLQLARRRCSSHWSTGNLGRKASVSIQPSPRKPSVSRRFLRLSRFRLWYPLVEPALLSLHHLRINPTSNGREDLGGPLILGHRHSTDVRGLELLRQFLQHSSPIGSTCAFFRYARLRPASRSTSLSSERGEFSLVISKPSQFRLFGADLLS